MSARPKSVDSPADHYAFCGRHRAVWIQSGKTPLPCKLLNHVGRFASAYTTTLHWDVNTAIDNNRGAHPFVPPKGAQKIEKITAAVAGA